MAKLWTRTSDMLAFLRSGSVVVAAGATADAGDVGAVDVDGDRRRLAGVAHPVDVTGRGESADVADVVLVVSDQVQLGIEEVLVLHALDDAQRAPGDVVMDPGGLPRPPDHGDDRERSV